MIYFWVTSSLVASPPSEALEGSATMRTRWRTLTSHNRNGFGAGDGFCYYQTDQRGPAVERAGAPAPTQPSAFHGRAGDTPVRALGKRGERAKIAATTQSNPHRHVRPFGSHRRISVPHPTARRMREPCGWIPDDAHSLAALAFRPADGRGEPGAKRDGRTPLSGLLRAPFDAAAFTTPFTNPVPVSHRRTSGLYIDKGSAARGRIWNGSPPPEWGIGTATRWAVTDGTEGKEGRRRHPTAHASLPLSPARNWGASQGPRACRLRAETRAAAATDPLASPHAVTCLACFTDRQWYAGRRKNRGALRQTVLPTPFRSASGF
ncbi:hypothetical protein O3P69_009736 [Scylla paramamosain]|uniref:Uncharacterized protein n=1 Tax=Scylla paramamosain TaxID=85552 RepID=A0AAW0SE67_SCYPA